MPWFLRWHVSCELEHALRSPPPRLEHHEVLDVVCVIKTVSLLCSKKLERLPTLLLQFKTPLHRAVLPQHDQRSEKLFARLPDIVLWRKQKLFLPSQRPFMAFYV